MARFIRIQLFILVFFSPFAVLAAGHDLLLLKSYRDDIDPTGWLMSEKLDGVRAVWDGQRLVSRGGLPFAAPEWFTEALPPFAIDGELWTKRGDFERIVSIVRRRQAHEGWRSISYNIFEVPDVRGGLPQRLMRLKTWLDANPAGHVRIIPQLRCEGRDHLRDVLVEIESGGGEGVVLRRPDTPYQTGRSPDALKVKSFQDAEGKVVGYRAGKGRLTGKVGALQLEMPDGLRFYVGSGLTDHDRENPPPLGAAVTYRFQGKTGNGLPRFPTYLRVRRLN